MKLTVRLFAWTRDRVGSDTVTCECGPEATVAELRAELFRQFPELAPLGSAVRLAVNQEYVPDDHPLNEADEVAVIPPVSGGSSS